MSTIWAFGNFDNKHTLYRGKDCMKKFCESSREHVKNVIDFKKKKMLPSTKEEVKSHQDAKVCYLCRKNLKKALKSINYWNVRDHCHYTGKYRGAAHSICKLKFSVLSKIPVAPHNGSDYDYHFNTKELANEFEGQFKCLGESTEKYKTFSVPIEKEVTNIDKDDNESVVTISCKKSFFDSARFIATSLSNLSDDLTEEIHKIKCKDCDFFLEYEIVKDNLIKYKYLSCNKNYSNKIHEELKKRFKNTFKFSENYINKVFILMSIWIIGKSLMKQHYLKKRRIL